MKRNYSSLSAFEVENFNFVESRKKLNYNLSFPFALHRKPKRFEDWGFVCLCRQEMKLTECLFIYPQSLFNFYNFRSHNLDTVVIFVFFGGPTMELVCF